MEVRKQQKITYLFGKAPPVQNDPESDERMRELMEDNKRLKKALMTRDFYAFQLERSLLPQPRLFQAKHQAAISSEISSLGGEAIARSKLAKQKDRLETYLRLFGIQVKAYSNERCVIMYNVRIKGNLVAQYGIQFTKKASSSDWTLFKYHMPLGLSLGILSDQPMSLEYLRQLQVALVAYHDRQDQIAKLKEEVPSHVYVSHNISGTYVEVVFPMIEKGGIGTPIKTALELKYDPFQNRPKELKIIQNLVTQYSDEFEASLSNQFEMMKYLNLTEGFAVAIKKDSDNNFYCPTEDEHDNFETESVQRLPAQRVDVEARRQYNANSDDETSTHFSRKPYKARQQENMDDIGSVSDGEESVDFNTLRRQMKELKQKKETTATFKKPIAPQSGRKRRVQKDPIEDSIDSDCSEAILKEVNKKSHNLSDTRTSSYQVTDDDLTTGSYVFIPESKKKPVKKNARKSNGNNDKENTKKGKSAKTKAKK